MRNGFRLSTRLPVPPKTVYKAWLSGREHSAMTGTRCRASARPGGRFTAGNGYIYGRNLVLKPHWCIVQSWRTREFSPGDPDSRLELCIHPSGKAGCKLLLIHTDLPRGQTAGYRSGWRQYYFAPMRKYFVQKAKSAKQAKRARPAKRASKSARRLSRRD